MIPENLEDALTSSWFQDGGLVILSTGVSVFAKIQSRNDRYGRTSWDDFAVGIDLAVASVIVMITNSLRFVRPGIEHEKLFTLIVSVVMIWAVSATIRAWGGKERTNCEPGRA